MKALELEDPRNDPLNTVLTMVYGGKQACALEVTLLRNYEIRIALGQETTQAWKEGGRERLEICTTGAPIARFPSLLFALFAEVLLRPTCIIC